MILDTSFLIDLMDGDEDAVREAGRLDSLRVEQRIPAQAVYELYVGVGYSEEAFQEVDKIQSVLESRPIEPTTAEIAKLAGRIDGTLQREGQRPNPADLVIGATARHYGEKVVAGTPDDFERIPDVLVRTYR